MERQVLVCPICGAPYRRSVPSGVAQVRCSYCGAAVLVPVNTLRCPNHPDLLATAACNDCGGDYCRDCLTAFEIGGRGERGTLQLCAKCLSKRRSDRAERMMAGGIVVLMVGVVYMLLSPAVGILFIVVLGVPFIAYGVYSARSSQVAVTFPSRNTAVEKQKPYRATQQMYQDMLAEFTKSFGASRGTVMLENRIKAYMQEGLSREGAIRRLAEEGAY